jgi:two-component system LytT family sensor kinase
MKLTLPKKRLYRHLLFWAAVFLFFSGIELVSSRMLQQETVYIRLYYINFFFESLPTYLFFTYLLLYMVIPLFLKKRYVASSAALFCLVLLTVFFQKIFAEIDLYFVQTYIFHVTQGIPFSFAVLLEDLANFKDWTALTYDFLLVGFIAGGIKIFNEWVSAQRTSIQLEQEKLQTELQLIKGQINPEFLFNTLDNLYGLTLQQSDLAPGIVLRLANLLSYLLYESQADEVLLEREIEMIDNYTCLTETHGSKSIDVSKQVSGDIKGKKISPLLLLPFIEYAFGVDDYEGPAWTSIDVSVSDDTLKLVIIKGTATGATVGFDNVRKRLDNLYPERYTLKLVAEEEMLFIKLLVMLNAEKILKPSYYETELLID